MKRLSFLKVLILSLFVMILFSAEYCGGKKKPCEENHTGSVKVYNKLGINMIVDVWSEEISSNDGFLGERYVSPGSSTTYNNVPTGYVEIWEKDITSDWGYWAEYVDQCETLEFDIYDSKKGVDEFYVGTPLNTSDKIKGERK